MNELLYPTTGMNLTDIIAEQKLDTKWYTLYDAIYMKFRNTGNQALVIEVS